MVGNSHLTWNIHNELTAATAANGDTAKYQYDALGRRTKRTETISGIATSTWFLTNGWNVELEYEFGTYARRMTWGQDISGTLQGAGGVGGLIMVETQISQPPIPNFPCYDGNGNITAWVNSAGAVTARQRYDAFGHIIEQTGTAPSRYGFSTKPIELVTGFLYYGYRHYDPVTGRWPSRDPIGELGGVNLFGFVWNNGVNKVDLLGLVEITRDPNQTKNDKVDSGEVLVEFEVTLEKFKKDKGSKKCCYRFKTLNWRIVKHLPSEDRLKGEEFIEWYLKWRNVEAKKRYKEAGYATLSGIDAHESVHVTQLENIASEIQKHFEDSYGNETCYGNTNDRDNKFEIEQEKFEGKTFAYRPISGWEYEEPAEEAGWKIYDEIYAQMVKENEK